MNRQGNREFLTELVKKLREKIPGIVLRTTLIAGFPGETEEQFEELCEFVKETKFERLGCFAYSQEEGTAAYNMEGQLDEETKQHRADIIMEEQMLVSERFNDSQVGKTLEVVVEGFDRYADCCYGRSAMDAPEIDGKIFFKAKDNLTAGDYIQVKIVDTMDYDLLGEQI